MAKVDITGGCVEVDDCDIDMASRRGWIVDNNGYAVRFRGVLMHRVIMNAPRGVQVDHRDGNRLNNCRGNLRLCSHSENSRNRQISKSNKSGFKGVYRDRVRYRAQVKANGVVYSKGGFSTAEDAYQWYVGMATKLHGEFARI